MKKLLPIIITFISLQLFSNTIFSQAPNLRTAANFGLFSTTGALQNTGPSYVTGNVGTNAGAFTGFAPATVTGQIELGNATTIQAADDVETLYNYMVGMSCGAVLGVTLGNNQVLTPNTYCIGAASTIEGDLYLDAQGDRNALFIFQINGAFDPGALTNVILINQASMCNVYWQVNGAFSIGANSVFRGNVVVNGAIALYNGSYLAGRAFSRVGAISLFDSDVVSLVTAPATTITSGSSTGTEETLTAAVTNAAGPFSYLWSPGGETTSSIIVSSSAPELYEVIVTAMNGCSDAMDSYAVAGTLPIELFSFYSICENQNIVLKWSTATEANNAFYSIERSTNGMNWQVVGTLEGAGNSSIMTNYSLTDREPYNGTLYYRLKQTDYEGRFKYFKIITVKNCRADQNELDIYPNPARGTFNLFFKGDKNQVQSISIYNALGEMVFNSKSYQSAIDLSGKPNGIYFLQLHLISKMIIKNVLVKKS